MPMPKPANTSAAPNQRKYKRLRLASEAGAAAAGGTVAALRPDCSLEDCSLRYSVGCGAAQGGDQLNMLDQQRTFGVRMQRAVFV